MHLFRAVSACFILTMTSVVTAHAQAITAPAAMNPSSTQTNALFGPQTLRGLLHAGFKIVETDAPAGSLKVRVILNRRSKLFSCEPELFRSGAGDEVHVLDTACIDLTP